MLNALEGVVLSHELLETAVLFDLLEFDALQRCACIGAVVPRMMRSMRSFSNMQDCFRHSVLSLSSFAVTMGEGPSLPPPSPSRLSLLILFRMQTLYSHSNSLIGSSRSIHRSSQGRRDKDDRPEVSRGLLLQGQEADQAGGLFFEFLDPLVEHGEGEFVFAAFVEEAVADDDGVEVAPFWYLGGEAVFFSYFFLPAPDGLLHSLDQKEQLRGLPRVGVKEGHDPRNVVLVLLLRTDLPHSFTFLAILLPIQILFGLLLPLLPLLPLRLPRPSRQPVREQTQQVDQRTRAVEERIGGQLALRDLAGGSADDFLELLGVVKGDGEELADEEEVEELLLDFGVHEYFVGHVGDECGQVDTFCEPLLTHHPVYLSQ